LIFLNVKQQVAACACTEKILRLGCWPGRSIVTKAYEFLAESPDIFRTRAIAALGNEFARIIDVLSCLSAIKA
jgi:hypothetical protein